jgi:hypothetical protein
MLLEDIMRFRGVKQLLDRILHMGFDHSRTRNLDSGIICLITCLPLVGNKENLADTSLSGMHNQIGS